MAMSEATRRATIRHASETIVQPADEANRSSIGLTVAALTWWNNEVST